MAKGKLEELRQAVLVKRRDGKSEVPSGKHVIIIPDGIQNREDSVDQEVNNPELFIRMPIHNID